MAVGGFECKHVDRVCHNSWILDIFEPVSVFGGTVWIPGPGAEPESGSGVCVGA